jgi:hypothetical protein
VTLELSKDAGATANKILDMAAMSAGDNSAVACVTSDAKKARTRKHNQQKLQ